MTIKSLIDYLAKNTNSDSTNDTIMPAINYAVRQIALAHAWSWLRRTIATENAAADTAGFLMPADMVNVIDPIIDSSNYTYQRLDPALANRVPSPNIRYFSFDGTITTPLVSSTKSVSIDKNTTALTFSPVLGATDYTGEFIQLTGNNGEDWGIHKMASNSNLVNTYLGKRISGGYYTIRPSTTKRISFTDYTGVRIAAEPTVHYWVYPEPVLAPQQVLPDIWEKAVRIGASMELQTETWDKKGEGTHRSMEDRYMDALSQAKIRDPGPPMQSIPHGNDGQVLSLGWRGGYSAIGYQYQ